MTLNWNNIDNMFKNTKFPILLLYIIVKRDVINDDELKIVVRFFFKYHGELLLTNNIRLMFNNKKHSETLKCIDKFYSILDKLYKILPFIVKVKKAMPIKFLRLTCLDKQISFIKSSITLILSTFDANKGFYSFISRLKLGYNKNSYNIFNEQMIERLLYLKNLLKIKFFKQNKIILFTLDNFNDLDFEDRVKYTEYMLTITVTTLVKYTGYLELFNTFNNEFDNLLNPQIIIIEENNSDEDIDSSDIEFIIDDYE